MTDSWKHWVFLSDDQLAYGTDVGTGRQERAVKFRRKHINNLSDDYQRDLRRHILAAKSELAGRIFLGPWAHWDDKAYGKEIKSHADLEDFIDVKEVDEPQLRLIVPVGYLRPQFAYMLVYCEEPWFLIKGWKWGEHIGPKELPRSREKGRPCYVVKDIELHDPAWLIEIALGGKK